MPIDSKGEVYKNREDEWRMLDTVMAGEQAVKLAGEIYLPKLSGQDDTEYKKYKSRGTFYNATSRTSTGFHGAIMRKKPTVEGIPDNFDPYLKSFTKDGKSFNVFVSLLVKDVIDLGFCGAMADMLMGASPKPYVSLYHPLDIINTAVDIVDGREKLVWITLAEVAYEKKADDPYEFNIIDLVREYLLIDGQVVVRLWKKDQEDDSWYRVQMLNSAGELVDELYPVRVGGKGLDEIPFVFFGAVSNSRIPPKPPLLDVANLNIKHWQLNVDYYHGLHFCALPTPWLAGFPKDTVVYIGPEKALVTTDADAKCGYLEFTGQGLRAVKDALNDLEKNMAVVGSRVLEEQKRQTEAAETARLRSSGDTATLSTIVSSVEEGTKQLLKYFGYWLGTPVENPVVKLNTDFVSAKLGSDEVIALLHAIQAGVISQDSFLYQLKQGEILPPDRTIEEEKALIEKDTIQFMETQQPTPDDTAME